ncbi:DNA-binding protein [Methylophaga sp. 42_25_T18]|nr:DNA-binding protein [Methylophaga sp. 42_25_T18]OUR87044.1 DNA-binding protein [Methylophaga sp. 42_8_T64]
MSKKTRQKHRILLLIAFAILGYAASFYSPQQTDGSAPGQNAETLYEQQQSNQQLEVTGQIIKLLTDDHVGRRHQRFIIKLEGGLTLLVAHNIDLADRIETIKEGDTVNVYGEYEWNERGGVIHWTHHDPDKRHVDGWIKHQGTTYQ